MCDFEDFLQSKLVEGIWVLQMVDSPWPWPWPCTLYNLGMLDLESQK